jgi:hypothetical protein
MNIESDEEKQLKSEISALDAGVREFHGLWETLAKHCQPRKRWITANNIATQQNPGELDNAEIIDVTAQQACQTLAGGQMAHITPMGQQWFALEPPEKLVNNPAAIRYYSEVTTAIRKALANSNFYNELHEQYLDRGTFGIAALETTEGPDGRGVWFRSFAPGTFAVAEDSFGRITTIARRYQLTAGQALEMFGEGANLPPAIIEAREKEPTKKWPFIYYIKPNPKHERGNPFSAPFLTFDICEAEGTRLLKKGRYNDLPVAVSRWMKWGENCAYGIGPAWLALPSSKQANYLEVIGDHLGELAAFPRFLMPSGMKGEVDLRPGGMTVFDANMGAADGPREWLTGGRYDILEARLERKKEQINAAFFVPLFELITQQTKQMTAYEVQQRVSEKGALFHPIFVRAVTELTTPVILRVYSILAQQPGALPLPPKDVILQDGEGAFLPDPEVRYVSPLALAITQNQLTGLPSVIAQMAEIAQFAPDALDSINTEAIYPHLARANALPESFIRTEEQIAEIKAQRAQAQQMQQAEQAASAIGKAGGAEGLAALAQ